MFPTINELDVYDNPENQNNINAPDRFVRISKVTPRNGQPRKVFNEEKLQELAESIKKHGIITPILVSEKEDHFEIIAGE